MNKKKIILKENSLDDIITEMSQEFNVDRGQVEKFSLIFFRELFQKIRAQIDFQIPIWGKFTFDYDERLVKPGGLKHKEVLNRRRKRNKWYNKTAKRKRKVFRQTNIKKIQYGYRLTALAKDLKRRKRIKAEKNKMKIVNKLFLRKVANELNYVLSLYK